MKKIRLGIYIEDSEYGDRLTCYFMNHYKDQLEIHMYTMILTDPTQKPDGTKQDTPPVPVDHEAVEKPSEPVADPEQPQAGDTSGNQIYVPGFGWVENHGGGGSGTAAEDMYENGNKIGIMD